MPFSSRTLGLVRCAGSAGLCCALGCSSGGTSGGAGDDGGPGALPDSSMGGPESDGSADGSPDTAGGGPESGAGPDGSDGSSIAIEDSSVGGPHADASGDGPPDDAGTDSGAGSTGDGASEAAEGSSGGSGDASTGMTGTITADHSWLRYHGRWDRTNPTAPVAKWGAVYVAANFTGTSCTVNLVDSQAVVTDIPGTGNWYAFSVDGGPLSPFASTSATAYPVASGLAPGTHSLLFARLTESKFGTTTFQGLTLDPGAGLAPPDAAPPHKLEVFGDSITAGLANEDTGYWTNATENGYLSFAPQAARLLDAEWHVEARGGGSFYNDYYLPMVPWFDQMFGPDQGQNDPGGGSEPWDFSQWQPDVLIVALGTNDSSAMYPLTAADEQPYVTKYVSFLTSLRGWYPHAEIFALAPFVDQQDGVASAAAPWDPVRAYIEEAVTTFADAHAHAIVPLSGTAATGYTGQWITWPDDYVQGDSIHPNIGGDTKIAQHLHDVIGPIMGW